MPSIVPQIGAKGIYTLLEPFHNSLLPNVPYQCVAVRRLQDIITAGGDPKEDYYLKNSLTEEKYREDLAAGVCIISLQASAGNWMYVPSSFIKSFPELGGIPYTTLALAISLSAIPDELDLSYVKSAVKDLVRDKIGVESEVRSVAISPTVLLSQQEHDTAEAARQSRIASPDTDHAKLLEVTQQRDAALAKIQQLEQYIRDNMAPTA